MNTDCSLMFICDKMELGICYKSFNHNKGDFKKISKVLESRITRIINKTKVAIVRSSNHPGVIMFNAYFSLNGNRLYRSANKLSKYPYVDTQDNNFITHSEAKNINITKGYFTLNMLPELIYETTLLLDSKIVKHIKAGYKGTVPLKLKSISYAFQEIEISVDVPIELNSDPLINADFLRNIKSIARIKFNKKKNIIKFTLFEKNIKGRIYVKDKHSTTEQLLRIELIFPSNKNNSGRDKIYDIAGKRSFTSVDDIKRIFTELFDFQSKAIQKLLNNISTNKYTDEEITKNLTSELSTRFTPEEREVLIKKLMYKHRFRIRLSKLARGLQERVKKLAKEGALFENIYSNKGVYRYVGKIQ